MLGIALFFLIPLYVVFCVAFGTVDPIFRSPVPIWNPLEEQFTQMGVVWDRLLGPDILYLPAVLRTLPYVIVAVIAYLIIAIPVAYFTATFTGKCRGLVLPLLVAPFFILGASVGLATVNHADSVTDEWLSADLTVVIDGTSYPATLHFAPFYDPERRLR